MHVCITMGLRLVWLGADVEVIPLLMILDLNPDWNTKILRTTNAPVKSMSQYQIKAIKHKSW